MTWPDSQNFEKSTFILLKVILRELYIRKNNKKMLDKTTTLAREWILSGTRFLSMDILQSKFEKPNKKIHILPLQQGEKNTTPAD